MAERLNYDIAAPNVIPMGNRLFSSPQDRIKYGFSTSA